MSVRSNKGRIAVAAKTLKDFLETPAGRAAQESQVLRHALTGKILSPPRIGTKKKLAATLAEPTASVRTTSSEVRLRAKRAAIPAEVTVRILPGQPQPRIQGRIAHATDIGRLIRLARMNMKLSQQQLADLAGVGRRFLCELEAGKETLELGKVLAVCRAAGVDLSAAQR